MPWTGNGRQMLESSHSPSPPYPSIITQWLFFISSPTSFCLSLERAHRSSVLAAGGACCCTGGATGGCSAAGWPPVVPGSSALHCTGLLLAARMARAAIPDLQLTKCEVMHFISRDVMQLQATGGESAAAAACKAQQSRLNPHRSRTLRLSFCCTGSMRPADPTWVRPSCREQRGCRRRPGKRAW